MAILQADKKYVANGVTVNVYHLGDHNDNGIDMPPRPRCLNLIGVTIHNTPWIDTASGTTPAEQYTRATKNDNMGSVRVHYYVDDELRLNIDYELFKKKIISKFWTEKEKDEFCNGNILKVLYLKNFIVGIFLILIIIGIIILILYRCYLKRKKKNYKNNDEIGEELELI
jgi:hypothetical protein